jgi:hypothetical protein
MASTIILSDNGASSGSAGLKETGGNDGVLILQTTTSGGTATNAVYVDNTQQVGFGTASPTARVTLSGTGAAVAQDFTNTTASTGRRYRLVSGDNGNAYITDMTGSADVLSIGSSGNTIALQGGSISAGAGIAFPATQVASSNANTLDDYEEGTWTPAFSPSGGGSITISVPSARYTKIGQSVTVSAYINVTSVSSPSGRLGMVGLPFAATNNPCAAMFFPNAFNAFTGYTGALIEAAATANLDRYDSTGIAADMAGYVKAGATIFFCATFFV